MNISSTINRVSGIKETLENEISEQLEQINTDLAVLDHEKRQQQPAGPKGKDYVASSKQQRQPTRSGDDEDDFEDAKKAVSELDKFDYDSD